MNVLHMVLVTASWLYALSSSTLVYVYIWPVSIPDSRSDGRHLSSQDIVEGSKKNSGLDVEKLGQQPGNRPAETGDASGTPLLRVSLWSRECKPDSAHNGCYASIVVSAPMADNVADRVL